MKIDDIDKLSFKERIQKLVDDLYADDPNNEKEGSCLAGRPTGKFIKNFEPDELVRFCQDKQGLETEFKDCVEKCENLHAGFSKALEIIDRLTTILELLFPKSETEKVQTLQIRFDEEVSLLHSTLINNEMKPIVDNITEINGHTFCRSNDRRHVRDIKFYECKKCGMIARVSMRSSASLSEKLSKFGSCDVEKNL